MLTLLGCFGFKGHGTKELLKFLGLCSNSILLQSPLVNLSKTLKILLSPFSAFFFPSSSFLYYHVICFSSLQVYYLSTPLAHGSRRTDTIVCLVRCCTPSAQKAPDA